MKYIFCCPLPDCGVVLETKAETKEEAVGVLVGKAKQHLANVHPKIKKTDKEVDADIRSHVKTEE